MSDAEEDAPQVEEKKKLPVKAIVFSAAGALAMGAAATGAAFFLSPSAGGCSVEAGNSDHSDHKGGGRAAVGDVAFINLEPLVVTLGANARSRYLKISISLETTKNNEKTLTELTPRVRDALNSYLRAVEEDDFLRPAAMTRIRAQMLRRLQLVAPSVSIRDVLITDFVLT